MCGGLRDMQYLTLHLCAMAPSTSCWTAVATWSRRARSPHALAAPEGPWLHAQQVRAARKPGYSPDFTGAVQHFCVHPGARMIIDKVSEVRHGRVDT